MSAFVATLGYSRMTYVHFVPDESFDSVHDALLLAFDYFGGVPQEVLFDNMKTVALERDAYCNGSHRFHPGLLQLADDLGFRIRLCRPYWARTKGKVERFNRYLRESFYNPLHSRVKAAGLRVDCDWSATGWPRWPTCACMPRSANARSIAGVASQARPADALAAGPAAGVGAVAG